MANHFSNALPVTVSGVKLRRAGELWQIAGPSVDAANRPGEEPAVKIAESAQASLPQTVQVPPVSVYEFEIANA